MREIGYYQVIVQVLPALAIAVLLESRHQATNTDHNGRPAYVAYGS